MWLANQRFSASLRVLVSLDVVLNEHADHVAARRIPVKLPLHLLLENGLVELLQIFLRDLKARRGHGAKLAGQDIKQWGKYVVAKTGKTLSCLVAKEGTDA